MGDVSSLARRRGVGNISYTCKPALIKKKLIFSKMKTIDLKYIIPRSTKNKSGK